ncbi:MAG: hypothetical protein JNM19_00925, partial [Chitinophagaceae bacterium]|nr:hypothetical protein [Chitinophagaceae bacterium]
MKSKLFLLLFLSTSLISKAANYYWVNGTGNWSDYANHWATSSGGAVFHSQVPTPADDVFFDGNSFTAAGQVVTVDQTIIQCRNMSWAGVINSPTFNLSSPRTLNIFGSLTLAPGMVANLNYIVNFESTVPGQTITSAGKTFSLLQFNGIGGGWTLQDNLSSSDFIGVNNGTLTTNGKTVSAFTFTAGGSSVIDMGSSIFNIGNEWAVSGTALSGTSTVNMPGGRFNGGASAYNNLNYTSPSLLGLLNGNNTFTGNVTFAGGGIISGNNNFNTLTFSPGRTYTFASGTTQTITTSFTATGSCSAPINMRSSTVGAQATILKTTGSVTLSLIALKDMNATGGAVFTANNSTDLGNNTGWTINSSAPKDLYWIGNGGSWADGNHWSLTSGGAPSGCTPTPVDNVFFNASSFTLAG